ncbi:hypothetical protein MAE02_45850 [Microvirga aerophila]|uniref:Uncharacterized protein n=1 Tax=Microvirga aerophila TaxID=670291 RepID=A0A512BY57_9HYPH|nr:hypothetical protein MAE02_45850 [Microvirga aerophila]
MITATLPLWSAAKAANMERTVAQAVLMEVKDNDMGFLLPPGRKDKRILL